MNDPPEETSPSAAGTPRRLGDPGPGVVRHVGPPGESLPGGVVLIEPIGLLVQERDGAVRMVGRIDEQFPEGLLSAGLRPPAIIVSLNGTLVQSAGELERALEMVAVGDEYRLSFQHAGHARTVTLRR